MKKRLIATGVLAGGVALTGLAGSAYAAGATPTAKDTGPVKVTSPVKGHGPVAFACTGKGVHIKGKPEKATFSVKEPGGLPALKPGKRSVKVIDGKVMGKTGGGTKALPAPPPGAKVTKALKDKVVTAKMKALPKGVRCFSVKPGIPGGHLPLPPR
jgi:hypothetical protein